MKSFFLRHLKKFGALYIFLLTLLVYAYSNDGEYMHFNYYTHLASSFLHGSLSIDAPPPWLSELAHVNGKHYVRFGVAPALLLMPFVALFGMGTNEAFVSLLLGAVDVTLMWLVLGKIVKSQGVRLAGTILFGFGSVFWFHAAYGNTWYFAHVATTLFLLLAINETLKERPLGFWVGFCLAGAALSRYTVILAFPFFFFLLWKKTRSFSQLGLFLLFLAMPLGMNAYYNYLRFGSFSETGYALVESQSGVIPFDPSKGLFHWSYLPFNFSVYFLKGPDWLGRFPWFEPNKLGMSILLTSPAALYAFNAFENQEKKLLAALSWLSVFLLTLPSLFYFFVGWKEFGWRYSLDFMPFLIILVALGFKEKVTPLKVALIAISILVNLWGVVYCRTMGW